MVGDSLAGLSLAAEAAQSGLERVLVLSPSDPPIYPSRLEAPGVTVRYETSARRIRQTPGPLLLLETSTGSVAAKKAVIGLPHLPPARRSPQVEVDPSVSHLVYTHPAQLSGPPGDVVVMGEGDEPVEWTLDLLAAGAKVVLCLHHTEFGRMSVLAGRTVRRLESQRQITVFWRARPTQVYDLDGFPMVAFDNRQTPDLQFDQVLVSTSGGPDGRTMETTEIEVEKGPLPVHLLRHSTSQSRDPEGLVTLPAHRAWETLRSESFPTLSPSPHRTPGGSDRMKLFQLEDRFYNATITWFRRVNPDLWIVRVRPDQRDSPLVPGQYATLGLGYWEPRVDGAADRMAGSDRLVRRSYSISSRIFDSHGYLTDPVYEEHLEFYIVLVPPSADRIPGLTPRLALKHEGDRIYLGPRMAGRYTLAGISDPFSDVLFLATGTGEAPHNAMVVELLRRGHQGRLVSVVSVRYAADLGYVARHRALEERFPNYRYLPLVTREDTLGTLRMRIQQLIAEDRLTEETGLELDPAGLRVFMCGNPAMIGAPEWLDERPTFSDTLGVAQLLAEKGFTLPRHGVKSNVHYEEYW